MWYYEKVLKIPVVQDFCYAHAGSVMHKVLELWYNKDIDDIQRLKVKFSELWLSYKLDESKISHTKDEYWLMVLNGMDLNLKIKYTELKIEFEDFLSFLDNLEYDDIISDWKSSKRREENEIEYVEQQKTYSWMYFRKNKKLPKLCKVYYLRYKGDKGVIEYIPNMEDIKQVEKQVFENNKKMEYYSTIKKLPERCDSCNMFCPYKELCEKDSNSSLDYELHILGNYIRVKGPLYTILNKQLHKKFSYELKNSYFIKKHKPYANTTIKFWDESRRLMPIGFLYPLQKTLNDYIKFKNTTGEVKIIDHRKLFSCNIGMPDKLLSDKELRDYQEEAVDIMIEKKIGLLQLGTGAGKTLIATEFIRRLKHMTLFVVDKIELLRQTKQVFEENLGIEVGQIGGGENDFKDVIVATIQTLAKDPEKFKTVLNCARIVIFDECHKISSDSFIKISHHLINAEYRCGISGSARRDDGNDMKITSVAGEIIYNMGSKQLIDNDWLVKPDIYFIKDILSEQDVIDAESKISKGLINESKDYSLLYKEIIMHPKRNIVVAEVANKYKNKRVLVIVKYIEHGEILNSMILNSKFLHGSTPKKEREQMFNDFANGDSNILISTINIFAEGIDIPKINVIINAAANTGSIKTVQLLGRELRKHKDKNKAIFIDFIDDGDFFKSGSFKRIRHFKREGHSPRMIDFEEFITIGGDL